MSYTATVKVMRSYDYCHFEINLGTDEKLTAEDIDNMRRVAASLVDRAVTDYRNMKREEGTRQAKEFDRSQLKARLRSIEEKPEGERTVNEVAMLTNSHSAEFWQQYKDDEYDYWSDHEAERDYHFSRLSKRQKVKV